MIGCVLDVLWFCSQFYVYFVVIYGEYCIFIKNYSIVKNVMRAGKICLCKLDQNLSINYLQ